MKHRTKRRQHRHPAPKRDPQPQPFTPVPTRTRHDGWTPGRQLAFVHALAASACVEEACAAVGMSASSYYRLRVRPDAGSFRQAVDAALDAGIGRLEDRMLGRALNGEATPVFYKGEQVGERRRYDNRLAMFLLRARHPERYGRWREPLQQTREHPDGAALFLAEATRRLAEDGVADRAGKPRPRHEPMRATVLVGPDEEEDAPEPQFNPAWLRPRGDAPAWSEPEDDPDDEWTEEDWAADDAYAAELDAQAFLMPGDAPPRDPAPGADVA